jgi:hypothetical protein
MTGNPPLLKIIVGTCISDFKGGFIQDIILLYIKAIVHWVILVARIAQSQVLEYTALPVLDYTALPARTLES